MPGKAEAFPLHTSKGCYKPWAGKLPALLSAAYSLRKEAGRCAELHPWEQQKKDSKAPKEDKD